MGRLLALDWGERRIGIALSDELQLFSSRPQGIGHVNGHPSGQVR